jgi:hypothetical protein
MKVYLLTEEQAQLLFNIEFMPDNYFNPIKDANNNFIISIQEVEQTSIEWVKSLELIDYLPLINLTDENQPNGN